MPWKPTSLADYDIGVTTPDGTRINWTLNEEEMAQFLSLELNERPQHTSGHLLWPIVQPRYEAQQKAQATRVERDILQSISDAEAAARAFLVAHDAAEAADLALTHALRTFRDAVGKANRYTSDEFYDGERFSLPLVVDGRVIMNDERNQSGMYIVRQVRLVGPAE